MMRCVTDGDGLAQPCIGRALSMSDDGCYRWSQQGGATLTNVPPIPHGSRAIAGRQELEGDHIGRCFTGHLFCQGIVALWEEIVVEIVLQLEEPVVMEVVKDPLADLGPIMRWHYSRL